MASSVSLFAKYTPTLCVFSAKFGGVLRAIAFGGRHVDSMISAGMGGTGAKQAAEKGGIESEFDSEASYRG
ncbi:MAG: hypothetical protein ACRD27_02775 [Terracidiphilus sp.]